MANDEYIAFIDLVGVKDAHATAPSGYAKKIADFQITLETHIGDLELRQTPERDCQVYIFSDCAFIRSAKIDRLISYLRTVRHACYTGSDILLFKGAIVKGTLRATESTKSLSLKGVTFSPDAVKAYVKHELSKAIGIVVDSEVAKDMKAHECVNNYYYPSERSKFCHSFVDLSHVIKQVSVIDNGSQSRSADTYQGITTGIVEHCRNEFFRATVRSMKLARYYPPIFCNWIQSVQLKKFFRRHRFKLSSAELLKESPDSPWAVYSMICNKEFARNFWHVPGIPILYFAILNKIYTEFLIHNDVTKSGVVLPAALDEVHKFILALKPLGKILDHVPAQLLNSVCREAYLDSLVDELPKCRA